MGVRTYKLYVCQSKTLIVPYKKPWPRRLGYLPPTHTCLWSVLEAALMLVWSGDERIYVLVHLVSLRKITPTLPYALKGLPLCKETLIGFLLPQRVLGRSLIKFVPYTYFHNKQSLPFPRSTLVRLLKVCAKLKIPHKIGHMYVVFALPLVQDLPLLK